MKIHRPLVNAVTQALQKIFEEGAYTDKVVEQLMGSETFNLQFLQDHYPAAYGVDRTPGANPIRQQLDNLKPEQRIIIDLAYFNGFTQDEIAKQIGIPLGTVKTRMRSAILELRRILH